MPGYVSDNQKLNLGGGVLRVVTHDWTDRGLSRLFTVDVTDADTPTILATLELARGEQLFATRFTEDRAYLVTFERVDPLWVIDLSGPARPQIAGEFLVPGYATQMVVDGTQLVTIGVDPTLGWRTSVSLFDVSNPAAPALLDREDVGDSSSTALWERKAFGVYPDRVLVPRWDGLAVVDRGADSLTLRGAIPVAGGALRGLVHGAGIVAFGSEEVVVADAATLHVIGRVTVAENVVDIGRLADGTLLRLVQAGNRARLAGAELELWAEALYPFGQSAAVVGWDMAGRAAYVVHFSAAQPVVAAQADAGRVDILDRLTLSAGAYDLRATGSTLFFSTGGGVWPLLDALDRPTPWLPESDIGTVRLGASLALGPEISGNDAFRMLLLPQDGAALVTRDGLFIERWKLSGGDAELDWTAELPSYPLRAHADAANPGRYLVALGYAGEASLP